MARLGGKDTQHIIAVTWRDAKVFRLLLLLCSVLSKNTKYLATFTENVMVWGNQEAMNHLAIAL